MKYKNRGIRPLNPVTVVIAPLALLATVLMAPSACNAPIEDQTSIGPKFS